MTGRWFDAHPGERLLDEGTIVVRNAGPHSRSETFRIFETGDGGLRIASQTEAEDGSYTADGQWTYDAQFRATGANGVAEHAGKRIAATIAPEAQKALLRVTEDGRLTHEDEIECQPDWLIDLEPSAMPMWVMVKRYDRSRGGTQQFRWIGRSLTRDVTLKDGRIDFYHLDAVPVPGGQPIQKWGWDERNVMPDGSVVEVSFLLWTDAQDRMLKFRVSGPGFSVEGTRDGDPALALIGDQTDA